MNRSPSFRLADWRQFAVVVGSSTLLAISTNLFTGGFALSKQGASGLGNAYAGAAAVSEDASTIWFNPAGISELKGRELSIAVHGIQSNTEWTDTGTTLNPSFGGSPVSGPETESLDNTAAIPNFYYAASLNKRWSYALGISVPFGSTTEYNDDWRGRYTTIKSAITVLDINPAVSFRLSDTIRLGGGISLQYLDAELTSAIDSGAVCFGIFATTAPDICPGAGLLPGVQANDSLGEVNGDSTAVSFNVGALFLPRAGTKLGLAYRHSVDHELDGTGDFTINPALEPVLQGNPATAGFLADAGATAEVALPPTLMFSAAHEVNSKLTLLGDVTWTGWSSFRELRIVYDGDFPQETLTLQEWQDVFRISGAINYNTSRNLTLRAGVAFDEDPTPSPARRTARSPGNDRTWLALGATWRFGNRASLDLGYAHLFLDETPIANLNEETAGGTAVRGLYNSSVDILSAQFNWHF